MVFIPVRSVVSHPIQSEDLCEYNVSVYAHVKGVTVYIINMRRRPGLKYQRDL